MNKNGFRTIIFDLGNVLLDIDINLTKNKFSELLGTSEVDEELWLFLDDFEAGRYTEEEFYQFFASRSTRPFTVSALHDAWNALLLHLPRERLEMLEEVRKHYHLVLLSNTNSIHLRWINNYLKDHYGTQDLTTYFDKTYLSHLLGTRKPEPAIYSLVIDDLGHPSAQALFIDDRPENVEASIAAGLPAVCFDQSEDLRTMLHQLNIL